MVVAVNCTCTRCMDCMLRFSAHRWTRLQTKRTTIRIQRCVNIQIYELHYCTHTHDCQDMNTFPGVLSKLCCIILTLSLFISALLFSTNLHCFTELTGSLSHWAVTKEPWTGGSSSPTKARSAGSSGRGDPPTSSQPSMKLLSNGELNFTREGVVVVDSLVTAKVHPGMGLAFNLMLLAPPEEPVALAAAFEQSVGLSNPEIRLAFCSQEIGTH